LELRHFQPLGCSKSGFSGGGCPGFWNNVFDLTIGHGWQARQNVIQIGVGFDAMAPAAFNDRVDDRTALTGIGSTEKQPIFLSKSSWPDRILDQVIIDLDF